MAAKAKDQDKMIDAAGVMTTACGNCHKQVSREETRRPLQVTASNKTRRISKR